MHNKNITETFLVVHAIQKNQNVSGWDTAECICAYIYILLCVS